jgi:hypothetical protein
MVGTAHASLSLVSKAVPSPLLTLQFLRLFILAKRNEWSRDPHLTTIRPSTPVLSVPARMM